MKPCFFALIAVVVSLCSAFSAVAQVTIDFRYGFGEGALYSDETGFFEDLARRQLLESAADYVTSRLSDSLAAMPVSDGTNVWTARFRDPSTGSGSQLTTALAVPENTLVVYVGGRTFPSSGTLADADAGMVTTFIPDDPFDQLIRSRGQAGALESTPTDFGPWGGSIAFNVDRSWSFATLNQSPAVGQDDFFTVAVHEIAHILGIGTADSWFVRTDTDTLTFAGQESVSVFGGPVPLEGDRKHFSDAGITPEPLLDPTIGPGSRKLLTALDQAALRDVGWQMSQIAVAGLAAASEPEVSGVLVDPASGAAHLSGTLDLRLLDGFVPDFGDTFEIVAADSRVGRFERIEGVLPATSGVALAPIYDHQGSSGLTLMTALPADADLNGAVALGDLGILLDHLGQTADWSEGDFNGDGVAALGDLGVLLDNLGRETMVINPPSNAQAVPEPTAAWILVWGSTACLLRRRVRPPISNAGHQFSAWIAG